jgi:hypothetical protein
VETIKGYLELEIRGGIKKIKHRFRVKISY